MRTQHRRILTWLLTAAILCLGFANLAPFSPVSAQDPVTGAFRASITDSATSAPIPGATVQFINRLTGVPIAKRTNARGEAFQGLLQPGIYAIHVTAPGYRTAEREQRLVATRTNDVIPVPIRLEREGPALAAATPTHAEQLAQTPPAESPTATPPPSGQVAQATPTPAGGANAVTSATPAAGEDFDPLAADMNRTDGRRGGAFNEDEVSTLPLGATTVVRTFDELALLLPGVALPPQTQGVVAGPGVGSGVGSAGQFAVNGMPSRANNFTVDGSDNNDEDIGVRRQGFLSLVPQPVESVQQYNVITLLAPAQYGRNIGAQVDAISKSGGNETHGSIYGFLNASRLNAPDFFDNTGGNTTTRLRARTPDNALRDVFVNNQPKFVTNSAGGEDSFTLGQFGLVLSGPLIPSEPGRADHSLFYFFSAEGQLQHASRESHFAVPTVAQRGVFGSGAAGLSANPFTGEETFGFPTSVAGDAIFSFFPFPNDPSGVYRENTFTQVLPNNGEGKVFSGKINGNFAAFGKPQELVARYNFTDDWRDLPVTGGALFSRLRPRVRTQNFSTYLNTQLSGEDSSHPVFNQLRASYGRTRLTFDEGREADLLLPTRRSFTNPEEARFLLNTRFLVNNTLPDNCFTPGVSTPCVNYDTFGTGETETQRLGAFVNALGPVGQINIAGFSPVGVDVFNFPQRRVNNTYQLADTLTVIRRAHNLAFGADTRRTELISDLPRNARPLITFVGAPLLACANADCTRLGLDPALPVVLPQDLAAAGAPSGFFQSIQLPGRDSHINLRYYQLDFFAQDQWRVRNGLTLSFGLRYEYNTPPREAARRIENAYASALPALVSGLADFRQGRTGIFEPDRNNFAPRVGFAWTPGGPDGRTVIRAGYGIFYDQILGAVVSQSRNVFPTFTTINFGGGCCGIASDAEDQGLNVFNPLVNNLPLTSIPIIQPGTLNTLNPAIPQGALLSNVFAFFPSDGSGRPFGETLPDRRLDMPMAHQFSATVEHLFGRGALVSAAYVGTRGRNLLRFTTPNLGPNYIVLPFEFTPENTSFGGGTFSGFTLDPGAILPNGSFSPTGGRPDPRIGPIYRFETTGESRYDALQLQLRGRLRSFQYQAAYTFSKAEDDVSDVFDLAGAPALPQNSRTLAGERGPSNFDARHRFSYNFIYTMPSLAGTALHHILGGLEIASTGQFQTGQPFTVNSLLDVNLDGNLTDRLNSTGGIARTGDRQQPLLLTTANTLAMLAAPGTDGSVGRNSFRAGNLMLFNVAVVKNFALTETQRLIFRMEVFNLTNRANFGIPVRFLEAPGFGTATDTVTPGRRIQFALKYNF
jgi:Carboxypeptidase regulatory-like domain